MRFRLQYVIVRKSLILSTNVIRPHTAFVFSAMMVKYAAHNNRYQCASRFPLVRIRGNLCTTT